MSLAPATLQNINLYLPEFRKKKHWLDAQRMVLVASATVALLVLTSAIEYWQLAQLRGDLEARQQLLQQSVAATAALVDEYGLQTEDPALLENIRALEADLQGKQALLQFLEGREQGNAEGLSEHMADLARYHVPGLSLNRISITNGGRSIALAGQVLKAELVPMYLQNLSKGRSYAGKNFDTLQIDHKVEGDAQAAAVWNFQVKTLD